MSSSRLCIFTLSPLEGALLAYVLESEFELETLQAHTEEEAISFARRATMLIIREGGPDLDRLALIRNVVRANPDIVIVVLEAGDGLGTLAYLQAGTTVYLRQEATVEELLEKVRAAQKGEVSLSPEMTTQVVRRLRELATANLDEAVDLSRSERLTPREREVARALSAHRSNAEIAQSLGIALGTAKTHVHNVMKKMDVDTRRLAGIYWRIHEHAAERNAE